jgi:hypothetical protein
MGEYDEIEVETLIKRMCDLVAESRRLAKEHDQLVSEYERLRKELEKREDRSYAASVGQGGIC